MFTLGTGKTVASYLDEELHLLPAHCYAVTGPSHLAVCQRQGLFLTSLLLQDVQDVVNGDRQLTILDSWIRPTTEPVNLNTELDLTNETVHSSRE